MQTTTPRSAVAAATVVLALGLAGCDGDASDDLDQIEENLEEGADDVGDAVEDGGDAIEEGTDEVGDDSDDDQ